MGNTNLNCAANHVQYRIIAEYSNVQNNMALAGFCAAEHTENVLLRHLQNLCVQTDGSLQQTHKLLQQMVQQWQTTLSLPAVQLLHEINSSITSGSLTALSVYKTAVDGKEQLVNRVWL